MHISSSVRTSPSRRPSATACILVALAFVYIVGQTAFLLGLHWSQAGAQQAGDEPVHVASPTQATPPHLPPPASIEPPISPPLDAEAQARSYAQLQQQLLPSYTYSRPINHTVGPPNVKWHGLDDSMRMRTAGFFTPYHITLGGGERYLLSAIKAAQYVGFRTEVLVGHDNVCQTVDKLMEVGRILRVDLTWWLTSLRVVGVTTDQILSNSGYDMFFLLGNEKYPMYRGLGRINIYMCQFPFDLDRHVDVSHIKTFSLYDTVLLNSMYSLKWFQHFISPTLRLATAANLLFPSFEILHPAIVPFEASHGPRTNIILLGRLFAGRQSKGHHIAIKLFKALMPDLPQNTRLILAGNVWPGEDHKRYVDDLQKEAQGLPIDFLLGQSSEVVQTALQSSLVQWHMTGLAAYSHNDPADHEHFGISIVEGMSAGCLPIAYCVGGANDIIDPGGTNGYLACTEEEFVQHTRALFKANSSQLSAMRKEGLKTVARFDVATFRNKFVTTIFRDFMSLPFRHYIRHVQRDLRTVPLAPADPAKQKHKAVIIEGRIHYAFDFVCRKAMLHLGPDWSLHVFHTHMNDEYVHKVLEDLPNVQYSLLDVDAITIPLYNHLLKSMDFWDKMGDVDKVLLFQVDTLILHAGIEPFLEYDFVGAPWHEGNERWRGLLRDMLPEGVGNGGFSLRSVNASKEVVRAFGAHSPDTEQEDMFFAINMRRLGFRIAPRAVAYQFCVEVACMDVPQPKQHFALHATWYYAARYDLKRMLDETLPIPVYQGSGAGSL